MLRATAPRMHSSTRRAFLQHSAMAATGAVAAPFFVPASALAAPGRPGANDRINGGYLGAGRRALQVMDLPPEARIVAAWTPQESVGLTMILHMPTCIGFPLDSISFKVVVGDQFARDRSVRW